MSFESPHSFYLLFIGILLFFIHTKTKSYKNIFSEIMRQKIVVGLNQRNLKFFFLLLSFLFLVIAIARPIVKDAPKKEEQINLSLLVVLDISKSMLARDVRPNRLEFAKFKLQHLLSLAKMEKIGVLGMSEQTYLISPITNDYLSIAYLVEHMKIDTTIAKGSDIEEMLLVSNKLFENEKEKGLILFSDGSDTKDFTKEIEYANNNGIKIFVYGIGTKRGTHIEDEEGIQKDANGNIVITSLNKSIKELALKTGGAYLEYSDNPYDLQTFLDAIHKQFDGKNKNEDIELTHQEELFYIPLLIALGFFLLGIYGIRGLRR